MRLTLISITSLACASSDCGTEAERLGGLDVDHQLEFGRQLDRQVSRLRLLEDLLTVSPAKRRLRLGDVRNLRQSARAIRMLLRAER